jgi:hypothetical protein
MMILGIAIILGVVVAGALLYAKTAELDRAIRAESEEGDRP